MDAPPPPAEPPAPPAAPPTTPGKIPDRRAGRLPAAAKTVGWLDAIGGTWAGYLAFEEGRPFDPFMMFWAVFLPLGIGVLARSNLLRILARIAHGLVGAMMIVAFVFVIVGALGGGAQGAAGSGGMMVAMMIFLTATTLGLTAFFVWGLFVLGRKDVRAACQRRSRATPAG